MRTIPIRTAQNVVIDYQLAGLRDRFFASFIDLMVVTAVSFILTLLIINSYAALQEDEGHLGIVMFYLPTTLFLFYHLISEVLTEGRSIGKRAMGIKVVRLDGQEARLSDYLLRTVFLMVDMIASFGIVGAMLISSSNKGQRLGDMTANTTVIRLQPDLSFRLSDILKINSKENYEPKYPEVKSLSEKDMLLVKQALSRQRNIHNGAHRKAINELAMKMEQLLEVQRLESADAEFLKTLLRDYIVLTR